MNTLGWILILGGALLLRSVYKGRAMNLGEDLSDAFLALVQGNTEGLQQVFARTGDANKADVVLHDARTVSVEEIQANPGLAQACINLGKKAKGYKFGATGPDYYDCSGLVWRACKSLGYTGDRFTTSDVQSRVKSFKSISKNDAGVNDIVLWPGYEGLVGHMGVMMDKVSFYSARSVRSGIGVAKIDGFKASNPVYLRYLGNG